MFLVYLFLIQKCVLNLMTNTDSVLTLKIIIIIIIIIVIITVVIAVWIIILHITINTQ